MLILSEAELKLSLMAACNVKVDRLGNETDRLENINSQLNIAATGLNETLFFLAGRFSIHLHTSLTQNLPSANFVCLTLLLVRRQYFSIALSGLNSDLNITGTTQEELTQMLNDALTDVGGEIYRKLNSLPGIFIDYLSLTYSILSWNSHQ